MVCYFLLVKSVTQAHGLTGNYQIKEYVVNSRGLRSSKLASTYSPRTLFLISRTIVFFMSSGMIFWDEKLFFFNWQTEKNIVIEGPLISGRHEKRLVCCSMTQLLMQCRTFYQAFL